MTKWKVRLHRHVIIAAIAVSIAAVAWVLALGFFH
jgi:hypothetical protein